MKSFLSAHDLPNWTTVLLWLLSYAYMVCGEKLERAREDLWAYRHKHGED